MRDILRETHIVETQARTILVRRKRVDSWFLSRYGMNLYRGCTHDCAYCDGRAEKYRVEGDFGAHITVKTNAPQLLARALDPGGKRIPLRRGFIMLGGGVCDAYQPLEEKYRLVRSCLEIVARHRYPVHILTKSCLVERDLDLLSRINQGSRGILSMSLSTADDRIASIFEPGASPPTKRLATLRRAKDLGMVAGVFLMPVIPGITDKAQTIEATVNAAADLDLDFVMFGGMTLKPGRQMDHFMGVLREFDPSLEEGYTQIYPGNGGGAAIPRYYAVIEKRFAQAARARAMPRRIPATGLLGVMEENDGLQVILEQMDYLLRAGGRSSVFGRDAAAVAALGAPLCSNLPGMGTSATLSAHGSAVVAEILSTGTCAKYESLLRN